MSNKNDIVVDIFAGSGVSTKVCIEEGRNSIACDIDPKLYEYTDAQVKKIEHLNTFKLYKHISDLNLLFK